MNAPQTQLNAGQFIRHRIFRQKSQRSNLNCNETQAFQRVPPMTSMRHLNFRQKSQHCDANCHETQAFEHVTPMASMRHLKCLTPYGVHASPKMSCKSDPKSTKSAKKVPESIKVDKGWKIENPGPSKGCLFFVFSRFLLILGGAYGSSCSILFLIEKYQLWVFCCVFFFFFFSFFVRSALERLRARKIDDLEEADMANVS